MTKTAFAQQLSVELETFMDRANQNYRSAILEIWGLLVEKTPVDRGPLRKSWYVIKGKAPEDFRDFSPPGAGAPDVSGITILDRVTIYNPLPYMPAIELGLFTNPAKPHKRYKRLQPLVLTTPAGFSRQAPQGVVKDSVPEIEGILQRWMEAV